MAAAGLDHPGVRGPLDLVVLGERVTTRPASITAWHDLAEAVVPLVADGFRERCRRRCRCRPPRTTSARPARSTGTSARAGPDRSRRSPRASDAPRGGRGGRRAGAARRPTPPSRRMSGSQRARRCRCTRGRSSVPSTRARRRARTRRTGRRRRQARREVATYGERARREVDAGDAAAEPGERHVSVPMWHWRCTTSSPVRSPRWGASHDDDIAQPVGLVHQPVERVAVGGRVHRHARLPVLQVRGPRRRAHPVRATCGDRIGRRSSPKLIRPVGS